MRKRVFFLFLLISPLLFAENQNLSNEMKSSYESGFYPGVVRYAEQILKGEKDTLAAFRASVYEGESLFRMGRIKDARSILEKYKMNADNLNPETIQLNAARFYWLGRVYFEQKDFSSAQNCFFSSASVFQELKKSSPKTAENSADYYSLSLLYGGKCYVAAKEYGKAIPLYKYVVSNPKKYSSDERRNSLLALAECYHFIGDYKTADKYYSAAGEKTPSDILTRFAIDSFNSKDYETSISYFNQAEPDANSEQKKIAAVYRAETAYITAGERSEGCARAIEILSRIIKSEKIGKPNDSLDETIIISLARYNGFLKNWKECESYAAKCQKSENPEIAKHSVYWIALSKYENGDIAKAVSTIEGYKKTQKNLDDKSILNLYAKALAKQGKYHEADTIFYSLGEKNQLDNDGRLDYSRTLLIAGHYISTKEQASKAKGDEALYLSALASFNQRRWKEAVDSFEKVLSSKTLPKDYVAYAQFYTGYAQYQLGDYEKSVAAMNRFVGENPLHSFVWSAYMTEARAAALLKSEKADSAAKNAISAAKTESEKHEAIILCAGILSDSKKYDEALSLLSPYISQKTEFGYECKYRSAEILVLQGKKSDADKYFAELASSTDKKASLLAEESAYRRAEIAYSENDFVKSAGLFEDYTKKFAGGRFNYAAIYFSADSLSKIGEETRAIMRYEVITDSSEQTSYRYGAEKNLVDLYAKTGDYASAVSMAQKMLDEYGSQAENDGISKKLKELQKLASKKVVSTEDRVKETQKNLERRKNDPSQSESNMNDAIFLAGAYRNKGENKKSAQMYLEAAKYSRLAGNDENAARCFYGAIESFDAAALYADSKATFVEMKKLYPENKYTKDAEKIINQM